MARDTAPSTEQPPMQLRIGFSAPTRPQVLHLVLSGLSVLVEPGDGNYDLASAYLTAAGVPASVEAGKGLFFPVKHLAALAGLPNQVEIQGDPLMTPLVELVRHPSEGNLPATLVLDSDRGLRLSWFDGNTHREAPFDPQASAALLNSEVSFVATTETWDVLKANSRLPVLAGRARVNLDGYVEISTTKPQLVEISPLPALFRIDDTHFGLPLAHASAIDSDPSFVWEGHRPSYESAPDDLPELPLPLSAHASDDLRDLVEALATHRAEAVVWESGLGRRVFCLAAVAALDAFPLLIVTSPSAVWAWQRHLDLFGRTHSLTHDRGDVHIITYRDLAHRTWLPSPRAIIFDGLSYALEQPGNLGALHRLDGALDAYRIAVGSSFPEDLGEAVEFMSVLRPGEFRSDVPLAQRYPVHTELRAHEHVETYVSRRTSSDPGLDQRPFKRSSVVVLAPTEAQQRAYEQASARPRDPVELLTEALVITSAGPSHATSPKIVAAAQRARKAASEGRSIALLTRHARTAQLLKAMMRPVKVQVVDATSPGVLESSVVVVRFDSVLPNLRAFDEVVVVDYPWSTSVLEGAVGASAEEATPGRVVFLHLKDTVDDRLAMLAARRRETGGTALPPDVSELNYLLASLRPSQ